MSKHPGKSMNPVAPRMTLAQLIADHRQANQITVRELAERIGIDHTRLWRFETGKGIMPEAMAKIMAWVQSEYQPINTNADPTTPR